MCAFQALKMLSQESKILKKANISKVFWWLVALGKWQSCSFPMVMCRESLETIWLLEKFQHPRVGKVCLIHLTGLLAQRWCLYSAPLSSHSSSSSYSCILFPRQGKIYQRLLLTYSLADLSSSFHLPAQVSTKCQQESQGGAHPLLSFPVEFIRFPGYSTAYAPSICSNLPILLISDNQKRNINTHSSIIHLLKTFLIS